MSNKLFKNDLTPSACQSDGNFGQSAWPLLLSFSPSSSTPSITPWFSLLEKTLRKEGIF